MDVVCGCDLKGDWGQPHQRSVAHTHEQATAQERGSVRGRKHQDCTRTVSDLP